MSLDQQFQDRNYETFEMIQISYGGMLVMLPSSWRILCVSNQYDRFATRHQPWDVTTGY